MGTIVPRKRKDGSTGYTAQIFLKRGGEVLHRESRTFDRRQAASAWLERRETELAVPGAVERLKVDDPTLAAAIDRYIAETLRAMGRTKAQVLRSIKAHDIAELPCSKVTSVEIVAFAKHLASAVQPQTVSNYLSHLAAVFAIARPAWGYPLDPSAMKDAAVVAKRLGLTTKSRERDRRPTLDELDKLMTYFGDRQVRRPSSAPMQRIIAFAIFSTRRMEEITRIRWEHFDEVRRRVMVADMKNPGDKLGNNVWCDMPTEAVQIAASMPKAAKAIFPYTTDAIGAAFTRACAVLGIEDLHFHDLRHEGISRLFEMGWTIPQVASVSGHRSWTSLKRYTHVQQSGDRYVDWQWTPRPKAQVDC